MIKGPKQFNMIQIYLNEDLYIKIKIKFRKIILGFLGHLPDFETKITFFLKSPKNSEGTYLQVSNRGFEKTI